MEVYRYFAQIYFELFPSMKRVIFWFRRDLRLDDNTGLAEALQLADEVIPVFIFDDEILRELDATDARVNFIYEKLAEIHHQLSIYNSGILIRKGHIPEIIQHLIEELKPDALFTNHDYEPYAIERDTRVELICKENGVQYVSFKDQVIFEKDEIVKPDGKPYTVFTPYARKWLTSLQDYGLQSLQTEPYFSRFTKKKLTFPSKESLGIQQNYSVVRPFQLDHLGTYEETRNIPSLDAGSYLSPHLRFGTVSIRKVFQKVLGNISFVNELIWREFFMQILYHFPDTVSQNFKPAYDAIPWRNDHQEFQRWCEGNTGFPLVDAGMRELNATGYMHNRVRMLTASFLCKHLLIDWRWGEAYFAKKLLDFELSSNVGNWQWAAGTGCDAAPYFRIFNPTEQIIKFDKDLHYIQNWIPEINSFNYPPPMIDHAFARNRALDTYKRALNNG